jgi:uncharacterized protein (TIGR03435 family)
MHGQAPADTTPSQSQTQPKPAFEVATIKPIKPGASGILGFLSYPGGRLIVGYASLKMLIHYAFDVPEFQIIGEPSWADSARYNIAAVPPDTSESRTAKGPPLKATPSEEQREMLQTLLEDRFGLKFHREYRQGPVYILSRGKKKLMLQEPKDKTSDPRGGILTMAGGIVDGSAFGNNISMKFLARQLSYDLQRPVLDQTGLTGSYDFNLEPDDPTNHDLTEAVIEDMNRLGLKLKTGKGPVEMIVIDQANKPSEN